MDREGEEDVVSTNSSMEDIDTHLERASPEPVSVEDNEVFSLEDMNDLEPVVTEVAVVEPRAHFELSYHLFTVSTTSSHTAHPTVVKRRFREFVTLRRSLVRRFPGVLVPPLPVKDSLSVMTQKLIPALFFDNYELPDYRRRALEVFLSRCCLHHKIGKDLLLRRFLFVDESWSEDEESQQEDKKKSSFVDSMRQFQVKMTNQTQLPEWMIEVKQYCNSLVPSVSCLKKEVESLSKRRRETATMFSNLGVACCGFGETEMEYESETGNLGKLLIEVGKRTQGMSESMFYQAEQESSYLLDMLKYYLGMIGVIMTQLEVGLDLRVIATARQKQVSNGSKTAEECGMDKAYENVENFDSQLRKEIEDFHVQKEKDWKELLDRFVKLQMRYEGEMKQSWEDVGKSLFVPSEEQEEEREDDAEVLDLDD